MNSQPQDTTEDTLFSWSLMNVWNKALAMREERKMEPRNRVWASELAGAYIDRYLRMTGVEPTNSPNARSLRKFDLGNFYELFLRVLLKKAGIFQRTQEYVTYQYPEQLLVSGRLDFVAGGKPDWDAARRYVEEWAELTDEKPDEATGRMPRWLEISYNFLNSLMEAYGEQELKSIIIEVKTCSSFMFDRYEQTNKPNPHHILQLFHYLIGKQYREGHIFYLCKDDGRAIEFGVFNPSAVEDIYRTDIEQMSYFYKNNIQPDREPLILFDPDRGNFQKNWKVEYSSYLYMLYGYETPLAYREAVDSHIRRFNNLVTRLVAEKPLTKMNLETTQSVRDFFPDFDQLVVVAKNLKAKGKLIQDTTESTKEKDEALI